MTSYADPLGLFDRDGQGRGREFDRFPPDRDLQLRGIDRDRRPGGPDERKEQSVLLLFFLNNI